MTEMLSNKKIATVLLAAGHSQRLGRPKQLLKFSDEYLINLIIKQVESSESDTNMIVLGAYEQEIRDILICDKSEIVINSDWRMGIGTSIEFGLKAVLESNPNVSGVLFAVVDQLSLRKEHIDILIRRYKSDPDKIIASKYEDTIGIPALFGSQYFDEILKLDDSEGCKRIIKTNIDRVISVDFPGGARDIDTEEDLKNNSELI